MLACTNVPVAFSCFKFCFLLIPEKALYNNELSPDGFSDSFYFVVVVVFPHQEKKWKIIAFTSGFSN